MKSIKQIILILFLLIISIFLGPSIVKAMSAEQLRDDAADGKKFVNMEVDALKGQEVTVSSEEWNSNNAYWTWNNFLCIDERTIMNHISLLVDNVIDVTIDGEKRMVMFEGDENRKYMFNRRCMDCSGWYTN